MRRVLAMFLLAIVMTLTVRAQSDDAKIASESGAKIKSIRIERAVFKNQAEGPRMLASVASYNEKGNVIDSTVNFENGAVYAKYAAKYDDDGNLMEETYTDAKGEVGAHYLFKADLPSKRLEIVNTKIKVVNPAKFVYALDDNGHTIEDTRYDKDGKVTRRDVIKRDANGQRVELLEYDGNDQLRERTVESYTAGRLAEYNVYDKDGVVIRRSVYKHDAKGNVIEETFYNVGGASQWRSAYVYDAQGNWIKKSVTKLVKKADQLVHEPSEVIYRTITYETPATASQSKSRQPKAYTADVRASYAGDVIKSLNPNYPEDAKRRRVEGHVKVLVLVDEQGNVASARALPDTNPALKDAVEAAAWQWKFTPTLYRGLPRRGIGTAIFNFDLKR